MTYTFPLSTPAPSLAIRRELDRLFDDVFVNRTPASWQPSADAREDSEGFTIELDLPGVSPEAVEVLTEDGVLTVKGTRDARELAEGQKVLFSESARGAFVRRFRLPKSADLQSVTATYTHGVLTVRVGKLAPAQARKIAVTVAG